MTWFNNMRIGTKIISGFILIALIAGVIGFVGMRGIGNISRESANMYNNQLLPISYLSEISTAFQRVRVNIRDLMRAGSPAEMAQYQQHIKTLSETISKNVAAFEKASSTEEEKKLLAEFSETRKAYRPLLERITQLALNGKMREANALMIGDALTAAKAEQAAMDRLMEYKVKMAKTTSENNLALAQTSFRLSVLFMTVGILLAVGLGLFIARMITRPVNACVEAANKIAAGDTDVLLDTSSTDETGILQGAMQKMVAALNDLIKDTALLSKAAVEGKLATRADAAKHQGDFRKIVEGVNQTLDSVIGPLNVAAEYVDRISKGDIPPRISDSYQGDFNEIKNNLNTCIDAVNALVADAGMLSEAAVAGKLATRANASRHRGDFQTVIEGVNQTLDAVIGPLNVAAEYVDRISKGDIPPRITDSYQGDFNELKNNLNTCIDAVNSLVADADLLSAAAVAGTLTVRADASRHRGDFLKIVNGVNETIARLVGFIDVMPAPAMIINNDYSILYMNEVGAKVAGRTPADSIGQKCYDHFKTSDCRTDKCACARALNSGSAASGETDAHPTAGVDLDVAYTGVPVKDRSGKVVAVFEIVTDLTAIRQAERLSTKVADYQQSETEKLVHGLTRLSQGNTDVRIEPAEGDADTREARTTFEAIDASVNTCVAAINALVADADLLVQAAIAGNLATRADASRHQGDFRKIVAGVNQTLDAVIGPLNVAAEYVDRISKGDIPPKITDNYNGDFNELKNNLNVLIDALGTITEVAEKIAQGDLAVEVKPRSKEDQLMLALKGMVVQLKGLAQSAERIAEGDLTVRVTPASDRDLMGNAFVAMVTNLRRTVGNVSASSDAIACASREIAEGSADLSQRTEEQAASLEETAASMEELTSTVKQNADNSQQANQLAIVASDVAVRGGAVIGRVVTTMDSISDSSKKIADIIGVIDGIAFQTNILALNAAVEAARAGEQGRGFAVVAGEVRNLAQRSAAAAKEIKALISDSVDKVGSGAKLVGEAGQTMQEIVTSIKRVTDIMGEISAASAEQSSGIEQVNIAVTTMDEMTQQNSAIVQQASTAAEALQEQAQLLVEAVGSFKLGETDRATARPILSAAPLGSGKTGALPQPVKKANGYGAVAKANGYHRAPGGGTVRSLTAAAVGDDADWNGF